jgi:SAM-dependent methyltransferase
MTGGACPVCTCPRTAVFLERHDVPANQNVVYRRRADAVAAPRAQLRMRICTDCGFVWNEAFDHRLTGYDAQYDNTQHHSPSFHAHMRDMARRVVAGGGAAGSGGTIVEIGCGKGDFLRLLVAGEEGAYRGVGFDTTYQGPEVEFEGRLRFERRLFDRSCVAAAPDLVVCRHVIEHIPDPVGLLRELRAALEDRQVRVFFETPDVEWILTNRVVWDFFHEHCSLFTPGSLAAAFQRAGFTVTRVDHVFGGQYLWLEATTGPGSALPLPSPPLAAASGFGSMERDLVRRWRDRLEELRRRGAVALWGAGAKGVTLANLCDPAAMVIDCVIDINPAKQGRFVPITGHPIVAPQALIERAVRSVVVMNPNYDSEIRATIERLGAESDILIT